MSLFGKGPLGQTFYQQSNIFRVDYWAAAVKMIKISPIFGLGFDSFDDWYTRVRGFISAYRTGPIRTSNSAHNIFLDLGVNGGLLLLATYLVIVFLSLAHSIKKIKEDRQNSEIDWLFLAFLAAWISYLAQALISKIGRAHV